MINDSFKFPSPTHNEDGTNGLKYVSVSALEDLPNIIDGKIEYKYKPKNDYQKFMRNNNKSSYRSYNAHKWVS